MNVSHAVHTHKDGTKFNLHTKRSERKEFVRWLGVTVGSGDRRSFVPWLLGRSSVPGVRACVPVCVCVCVRVFQCSLPSSVTSMPMKAIRD